MTTFEFESEIDCATDDRVRVNDVAEIQVLDIAPSRVTLEVNDCNGHYIVVVRMPPPPSLLKEDQMTLQTDLRSRSRHADRQNRLSSDPSADHREDDAAHESWSLEYLLLGDLVELLQEPYDSENRRWLLVVLDGLLDAIPAEGRLDRLRWFQSFFQHSECLQTALIRMELEYEELIFQLRKLRNRVAWRLSLLEVLAAEVCCDLKQWLQNFQEFSARETEFRRTAEESLNDSE